MRNVLVTSAAIAVCLAARNAHAAPVVVNCPGMPPELVGQLQTRTTQLFTEAGIPSAQIHLECNASGVWIEWFDHSRAMVDQSGGLVPGALALIESRLAQERGTAPALPPATGALAVVSPETPRAAEIPPEEPLPGSGEVGPEGEALTGPRPHRYRGPEGGIGLAMVTEFGAGSAATALGPRLDVSIGPPGPVAVVLGEGVLFGVGSEGSSQILILDFQAGVGIGAPFKTREGFGAVALIGAERMAAMNSASEVNGQSNWAAVFDIGARGSLAFGSTNLWLGLDAIFRSSDFELGGPNATRIPTTSILLSLGCFFPAMGGTGEP
jgi:hypothetical protein